MSQDILEIYEHIFEMCQSWRDPKFWIQDKTSQSITAPTLPEVVAVKEDQDEFRGEHPGARSYSWKQCYRNMFISFLRKIPAPRCAESGPCALGLVEKFNFNHMTLL